MKGVELTTIEGFKVLIVREHHVADVLVLPHGHFLVHSEERTIRPITRLCVARLMRGLQVAPHATAEILQNVEHVADLVFPSTAEDVSWQWELPDHEVQDKLCN
jgi:hypothetical protein